MKGEKKLSACDYQEHVDEGDEHCEADHPEKHHMHHIFCISVKVTCPSPSRSPQLTLASLLGRPHLSH